MFAWKTRYIVTDEQVRSLDNSPTEDPPSVTQNAGDGNPLKLELEDAPKSPLKLELEEDTEDATDESKVSEEDKDRIALAKLKLPTIYTITQNELSDNKPLVMWGILNSKQFAGL